MHAYLNGKFIPLAHAVIPIWDYGFTMGVAVTEQLRTFNGRIHGLDYHLERMATGLAIVGIELKPSLAEIGSIAQQVAIKSFSELPISHDLAVGICITPGAQAIRVPAEVAFSCDPTVLIYAMPLVFTSWSSHYESGVRLATVETREIPVHCIPKELKCRSRMHYFLAEREAEKKHAGSRALLLDMQGFVAEGTTASVLIVKNGVINAPPAEDVLPSVSVRFVEEVLAPQLGIEINRHQVTLREMHEADELLWLSTSSCILPISHLDGHEIGSPSARPVFSRLIAAWSEYVGIDIIAQAKQCST